MAAGEEKVFEGESRSDFKLDAHFFLFCFFKKTPKTLVLSSSQIIATLVLQMFHDQGYIQVGFVWRKFKLK